MHDKCSFSRICASGPPSSSSMSGKRSYNDREGYAHGSAGREGGDDKRGKWSMPAPAVWTEKGHSLIKTVNTGPDGRSVYMEFDATSKAYQVSYYGPTSSLHTLVAGVLEQDGSPDCVGIRAQWSQWAAEAAASGERTGTVVVVYRIYEQASRDEMIGGPISDPKRRYHTYRVAQPFKVVTAGFTNTTFLLGKYLQREAAQALVTRQLGENYKLDLAKILIAPASLSFSFNPTPHRATFKTGGTTDDVLPAGDIASGEAAAADDALFASLA